MVPATGIAIVESRGAAAASPFNGMLAASMLSLQRGLASLPLFGEEPLGAGEPVGAPCRHVFRVDSRQDFSLFQVADLHRVWDAQNVVSGVVQDFQLVEFGDPAPKVR